jgi:NAD-specific glutamate dehydrogenase
MGGNMLNTFSIDHAHAALDCRMHPTCDFAGRERMFELARQMFRHALELWAN